jgi:hypothetical protein
LPKHTVRAGETLSSIARAHGYADWKAIYDHPNNAELKRKRPNPGLILPGDVLFVPDRGSSPSARKTEFQVIVTDSITLARIPNITLSLRLPDFTTSDFTTDPAGVVHLTEPAVTRGTVTVVAMVDRTAQPTIRFPTPVQNGLSTDATNSLRIPNKRKVVDDIATAHGISRRSSWGKKTPRYAAMDEDWDYEYVVLHHSGNSGERDPIEVETKHMVDRGWDDVGYHYMITPSGSVFEGCYLTLKGSHVEKANSRKIGILMMGDFEHQWWDAKDDKPFAAQIAAAESLIQTLKKKFSTLSRLGGHRDYKPGTVCPGAELYKLLPAIRGRVGLGGP